MATGSLKCFQLLVCSARRRFPSSAAASRTGVIKASRSFSSVGTPDTADPSAATIDATTLAQQKQISRPIFPWRHEPPTDVLPRLTPGTKEYETIIPFPTPQQPFASLFLGVSLWDAFVTKRWKPELTESMTYAFVRGLAGIISNVYRIPFETSSLDNEKVKFSYPVQEKESTSENGNTDDSSYCPQVDQMLAPPLRELFKSAHESGRDQLRILLETTPVRSHFYRLYAIPFFTRDVIEKDPSILTKLFNDGKPDWNTVFEILQTRCFEQLDRHDYVETTIAAEVYIICEEKFQVLDAETGVVLQGPEGVAMPQEVGHVVTFEMTARTHPSDNFPYLLHGEQGNWQITDIDDLVSSKKWYHVP